MLIPYSVLVDLQALLDTPADGMRVVAVDVDLDPLDLVRAGASSFGFAGFFSSPEGRVIGGLGTARRLTGTGSERLARLDGGVVGLPEGAPVLVGFSFGDDGPTGADWEGFAAAAAIVPEAAVVREGGTSRLVLVVPPGSDGRALLALLSTLEPTTTGADPSDFDQSIMSIPAPADWIAVVDEAVAAIRAGQVAKVVLARSVEVRRASFDPFQLVARLRDAHPGCRVFGWQEGDAVFVGASPELLVARRGDHMHLAPLAGSAARGADLESDRHLGEALLASGKDRFEHEVVVADALARLAPLATGLHRAPTPHLQRFEGVQHLATPITGTTSARVLALAAALHPTAAVGGAPRDDALAFIAKLESVDRGWYAGGIGWLDPSGDGELAIGLRCALIRGDRAILYAGNGIVADSDPVAELEETRLKLRALLDLLT